MKKKLREPQFQPSQSESLESSHIEELRVAFNLFDSEGSGLMNSS